jgi:hypothetical protein
MTERRTDADQHTASTPAAEYEAPRVESVVTSDEIEREAVFGGGISMNT